MVPDVLPDDMHLYHDRYAIISAGPEATVAALPPDALLISSLRRSWPNVVLNVSLGDRADVGEGLSARFGGGPGDYQLAEMSDEVVDGQARIRLLVHPQAGPMAGAPRP